MFRVETFAHAGTYYERMAWREEELHLVPTEPMASVLRKGMPKEHVWVYSDLVRRLFSEWHHPLIEVYLTGRLRDWIGRLAPHSFGEQLLAKMPELLSSFRLLADLFPVSLREDLAPSEEFRLVARIFSELCKDELVMRYVKQRRAWNKDTLRARLRLPKLDTFVVHLFDYLDASRMLFFYRLRKMGFQVVFRIPYERHWTKLYRGWKSIYEALSMQEDASWLVLDGRTTARGKKLALYLEGREGGDDDPLTVTAVHFRHPVHFKSYVRRHRSACFVAVEEEPVKRFADSGDFVLSAPWSRLIAGLFKCRRQDETVALDYDTYVTLLLSGWFDTSTLTAQDALGLLCDLRGYMDGVRTLRDIVERLQALSDLQEFSQVFDQQAREQTQRHLAKQYLSNPFRAFSFVHGSRYQMTVKQLLDLTRGMERKLQFLLVPPKQKVSAKVYLDRLKKLFEQVKNHWPPDVVRAVETVLSASVPDGWAFEMPELLHMLEVLWRRQGDESANFFTLASVNGLALLKTDLHLTDLSMQVFPQTPNHGPAFLDYTWLKQSIQQSEAVKNKRPYLHALLVDYYSRKMIKEQTVYQLYYLLANGRGRLTVSWIEGLRDDDTPSIYFHILQRLYGHGDSAVELQDGAGFPPAEEPENLPDPDEGSQALLEVAAARQNGTVESHTEAETVTAESADVNRVLSEKLAAIPELYWLDMDFCARKFFLNAFIQHQPVYEHDFHQQLVFGIIGKYFTQLPHVKDDFVELVYPLFPQWTTSLKTNLIDTEFGRPVREYKKFENIYHPKAMQALQVLRSRYLVTRRWKMKHRYQKGTFRLRPDMVREVMQAFRGHDVRAEKGDHCSMCPHLHVCVEGEFAADAYDD